MTKRRGHGEGTIYQRKDDGLWVAKLTIGVKPDGSPNRKTLYGKTRKIVQEKLTAALAAVNAGTYIETSKLTLGEWLDIWFKEYTIGIKQSTRVSYDGYINSHIKPVIGQLMLSKLNTDTLQAFFNDKHRNGRLDGKGGLEPKTLRNMRNMLRQALEQAVNSDRISKNPINGVRLPPVSKKPIRVLSMDEQNAVVNASYTERHGFCVRLALDTGMREGELCGLHWTDIDFKEKVIKIGRTLQRLKSLDDSSPNKTEIVIDSPKTQKSRRDIPLSDNIMKDLLNFKKAQTEEKLLWGCGYRDMGFIFAQDVGWYTEPRTMQDMFKRVIGCAGIDDAPFHALRHTFATRALEEGIAAKVVSDILGHSTVAITLDLYSHVLLETKRDAINRISKYTSGTV